MSCLIAEKVSVFDEFISSFSQELRERAEKAAKFFFERARVGIYELADSERIDWQSLVVLLGFQKVNYVIESYSQMLSKLEKLKKTKVRWDSSVRGILLADNCLSSRLVDVFPGFNAFSSCPMWQKVCHCLQTVFGTEEQVLSGRLTQPAYYWHDALQIFANYLMCLSDFSASNSKETEIRAEKCEAVIHQVLPYCVPVGWLSPSTSNQFLFLCK